jgi:hypothetical protein
MTIRIDRVDVELGVDGDDELTFARLFRAHAERFAAEQEARRREGRRLARTRAIDGGEEEDEA